MNLIFLGQFTLNISIGPSGGQVFSQWSTYSSCSDTCGQGVKFRTRTCDSGACSSTDLTETAPCNEGGCK